MSEVLIGAALLAMACVPALSARIQTGLLTTLGLFAVALGALGLIFGFGASGTRGACIWIGASLAIAGEVLHWRHRGPRWAVYRVLVRLHGQQGRTR